MNGPTLAGDAPKGEPISVLNVAWGQDTGGQQYRLRRSWWKHRPEDRYVTVTQRSTFYEIEHRMDASKLIRKWIPEADVLHLHNDPGVIRQLRHAPPSLKAMQRLTNSRFVARLPERGFESLPTTSSSRVC